MTFPRSTHPRGKSLISTGIIQTNINTTTVWRVICAIALALANASASSGALQLERIGSMARRELAAIATILHLRAAALVGLERSPLRRLVKRVIAIASAIALKRQPQNVFSHSLDVHWWGGAVSKRCGVVVALAAVGAEALENPCCSVVFRWLCGG